MFTFHRAWERERKPGICTTVSSLLRCMTTAARDGLFHLVGPVVVENSLVLRCATFPTIAVGYCHALAGR